MRPAPRVWPGGETRCRVRRVGGAVEPGSASAFAMRPGSGALSLGHGGAAGGEWGGGLRGMGACSSERMLGRGFCSGRAILGWESLDGLTPGGGPPPVGDRFRVTAGRAAASRGRPPLMHASGVAGNAGATDQAWQVPAPPRCGGGDRGDGHGQYPGCSPRSQGRHREGRHSLASAGCRQHECGARTPVSGPARLLPASRAGGVLLMPLLRRRAARGVGAVPGGVGGIAWGGGARGSRVCRVARRERAVCGVPDFRGGRALYGPGARWPVPSIVEGAECFSVTGSALGYCRVRMGNWPYGVWCGETRW